MGASLKLAGVILLMFSQIVSSERNPVEEQMFLKLACVEQAQCGACLAAAAHCRWCADPYFHRNTTTPRCNDEISLVEAGCAQYNIQQPKPPVLVVLEDRPLQDRLPDNTTVAVQLQPQRIRLSLRPRESRSISFTYRPARNYPLDLYYLMDLTWSMKDDKETLVSLRDDLPVMLKNLTDNFRLGFGSFAEKPLMPYMSIEEHRKVNPCSAEQDVCEPTYSFRHHLSLTDEVIQFIERVNSSSVTANLDNAEAGLDALLQSLVCREELGWGDASRKIIILLSDGLLHFAGDGKLGGVIERNDEKCHLDKNGFYSTASLYDYPSLSQIYRLLDTYKVNVIFAVTENVKGHYDDLHQLFPEFTYIGKLEANSANILKLVKKGYEDIVSVVHFDDDATDGPTRLVFHSDCGVENGPMVERRKCTGVEFGKEYNFEVQLTLDSCPEFKNGLKQTISITESQLGQDSIIVEVELLCGCECEGNTLEGEGACAGHSHMVCGVCQCLGDWSGPNCDCQVGDDAASAALAAQCREPGGGRAVACAGAGDCLCGACYCDRGHSGKYCQCTSCPISRENELECGGVGRGACACGSCACAAGWSGAACSCAESRCVAPGDTRVCSDHGNCVCGECQCSEEEGVKFAGAFCETCPSCSNQVCARTEPCVSCTLAANCTSQCLREEFAYNVSIDINGATPADEKDAWCVVRLGEDSLQCEYGYTYRPVDSHVVTAIVRTRTCGQLRGAMLMTSGLIIMVCVVAAGLVVVMFVKSAQVVADRRAYAKFLAETERSMLAMSNQNPLYISPISEFTLPDSFPRDKAD